MLACYAREVDEVHQTVDHVVCVHGLQEIPKSHSMMTIKIMKENVAKPVSTALTLSCSHGDLHIKVPGLSRPAVPSDLYTEALEHTSYCPFTPLVDSLIVGRLPNRLR